MERIDTSFAGMTTMELTPAELALHLGFALPADAERSALETESLVEASWLTVPRFRYTHEHMAGAHDFHMFKLTEPMDAEGAYLNDAPPGQAHQVCNLAAPRARPWMGPTTPLEPNAT